MTQQEITTLITTGGRFRIVYKDSANEITERVIDIERIFTHEHTNSRLLVAFCWRRRALRTFNMNNILAAMPDDSIAISSFGMIAAVTKGNAGAFHVAHEAFFAAVA